MTALVIGKESIEIKWAKRKVAFNLKTLCGRLDALDCNSSTHARMHAFYSKKIEKQTVLLEWLNRFYDHSEREPVNEIKNECAVSRQAWIPYRAPIESHAG